VSGALTQSRAAQYTLLHGFAGAPSDGNNPQFGTLATDGTTLYGVTFNGGITNRGVVFKINVTGSGYQVLHSFSGLSSIAIVLGEHGITNDGVNPARQVKQSPHRKEDPKLGHPVICAQKRDSVADQPDGECGIKNREERVVYAGIRFDECAEALARCWINGTGIGGPPVSVDSEN